MDPARLIRLSNDAWAVVLIVAMVSFMQYAVSVLSSGAELLQYMLTITIMTVLVISFFVNSEREIPKFFNENIFFFALFVALLTTGVSRDIIGLLLGFFVLLWVYFFLCLQYPEVNEATIDLHQLVLVAIVQLLVYSLIAALFLGWP